MAYEPCLCGAEECHHCFPGRIAMPKKRRLTLSMIMEAIESPEYLGFCLACGEQAEGVEADACAYECEACGAHKVYGAEELLIMGFGGTE